VLSNNIKLNPKLRWATAKSVEPNPTNVVRLDPTMPSPSDLAEAIKNRNFEEVFELNDHNVAAAYSELYTNVSQSRMGIVKEVERMAQFYLVDAIVSQFIEDALTPEIATNEILEVRYETEGEDDTTGDAIQKEIDDLDKKLDLDQLCLDIAPDLVRNGEYTLKNDFGDKRDGIKHIRDTVDQGSIVAITQDGKIKGYLEMNDRANKLIVHPPKYFTKFVLAGDRVRVNLKKHVSEEFLKSEEAKKLMAMLPRYVRVGKSIVFPILPKIKELELLEKLVPATKLAKLSGGSIVGMQVPESFDIGDALKATKRVEGLVNNKIAIDDNIGEVTVQAIMSSAGRVKVIPVFGDKGNLSKLDYKSDEPDDLLSSVQETRQVICDSIGIPYELLFRSDDGNKSETIKRYAKYLRRLKNIQRAITKGVEQLIMNHLVNKGIDFEPDKIKVEFRNKLVEIDNLDKLEHMDVTVSLLGNLRNFVGELLMEDSPLRKFVNITAYKEYMQGQLDTIGLGELLTEEENELGDGDDDDFDDFTPPVNPEQPPPEEAPVDPNADDDNPFENPDGDVVTKENLQEQIDWLKEQLAQITKVEDNKDA
jgi:hypothetical protein